MRGSAQDRMCSARLRRNGACRAATLKSDSGGELRVLGHGRASKCGVGGRAGHGVPRQPLWVEEPAVRRRMPDPVRTAAVRAVLIMSLTMIQAMVALLSTLTGSWLAFPMMLSSVAQHGGRDLGGAGCVGDPAGVEPAQRCGVRAQQHGAAAAPGAARGATGGEGGGAGGRADTPPGHEQPVTGWSTRPGEELRSVVGRGVGSPCGPGGVSGGR